MPLLNINNTELYYESHGTGIPLVLVGGLKADHAIWLTMLDSLSKHYQVIIFDNRGAGRTLDAGDAFDVATMADDTMELIEKLQLTKPHLIGHSLGGAIAQVIAKKYADKIRSVALCNTFAKINTISREIFANTLNLHKASASPADIMSSLIPWAFSKKFITADLIDLICKTSNENPFPQSLLGFERQLNALNNFDSHAWFNTIKIPALIMGSEEDIIATPEDSHELANGIPNSQLALIPGGHASQVEQPEVFVQTLINFIDNQH